MPERHPPSEVAIAYHDAHLLILYKPSGLPTTAPDPHADTLVARAKALDPDAPKLHASSRLDAEVSGLVTFARTAQANARLLEARKRGRYQRRYLGIVARDPSAQLPPWIDAAIAIDPADPRRRVIADLAAPHAKSSQTELQLREAIEGASLLELRPKTGRTHQLRVHAQHVDAPLLGDRHYGNVRRVTRSNGRVILAPRVMLACVAISVPAGDRWLDLRVPPADDLASLWTTLGGSPEALTTHLREEGWRPQESDAWARFSLSASGP